MVANSTGKDASSKSEEFQKTYPQKCGWQYEKPCRLTFLASELGGIHRFAHDLQSESFRFFQGDVIFVVLFE